MSLDLNSYFMEVEKNQRSYGIIFDNEKLFKFFVGPFEIDRYRRDFPKCWNSRILNISEIMFFDCIEDAMEIRNKLIGHHKNYDAHYFQICPQGLIEIHMKNKW